MAIWGKDVLDNLPFNTPDDELELSVGVNTKLRRRMCTSESLRSNGHANNGDNSSPGQYPCHCRAL